MQCQCGYTAQYIVGRDGKPSHICARNRCKFWAIGPTSCDGYHRVMLGSSHPSSGTVIVRFEALLHPELKSEDRLLPAVMAICEGYLYKGHCVREILEDPIYEGKWFSGRKAYLYTLNFYAPVLSRLQQLSRSTNSSSTGTRSQPSEKILPCSSTPSLNLLLEPIPNFFFKCLDEGNQYARQFSSIQPDTEDIVYQQLQPFQKKGVEFILQHGGRGMIADEMGLGKTVQAIAVAHFYRDEWPLLVVCPMSLMENWAKEICRFCSIPFSRIGFIQGKKIVTSTGEEGQQGIHDIIIASYHSLKELKMAVFQIVIFDESHYIKTPDSKRTVSALELSKKAKRVLLLTGTPTLSRPMELYTQLRAIASLHPALLPTNNQFAARYCNAHIQSRGGMYTVNTDGHSHTDELHLLLQHFLIRREKKELQHALPSKSRQILYVTVAEKGRASIAKLVSSLKKNIASHTSASTSGNSHLTVNEKDIDEEWVPHRSYPNTFELKIATAQLKIPAVMDYVASMVEKHRLSKQKMIVFAHHQCMMDALKEAVEKTSKSCPVDYISISGETPAVQREELAEHFRSDPHCIVALLTMQSSGVGHNFTCASTVIFSELDWNPSTHLQCEDRVHRIGQSKPCVIQYLLAEGTSDSIIWPLLNTKLSVTTAVLSGSAGGGGTEARGRCDSSDHSPQTNGNIKACMRNSNSPLFEADVSERRQLLVGTVGSDSAFGSQLSNGKGGTQKRLDEFFPVASSQSVSSPLPLSLGEESCKSVVTCSQTQIEGNKDGNSSLTSSTFPSSIPLSLPLLVSFSEISTIDPKWRETAYALSIPGCHPASETSSPALTVGSSSQTGKTCASPSVLSSLQCNPSTAKGNSLSAAEGLREGRSVVPPAKNGSGAGTFSGVPVLPRRTTFKLRQQAPPTGSPSVSPPSSEISVQRIDVEAARGDGNSAQECVSSAPTGGLCAPYAPQVVIQEDALSSATPFPLSASLPVISSISQPLSSSLSLVQLSPQSFSVSPSVGQPITANSKDGATIKRCRSEDSREEVLQDIIHQCKKRKQTHWYEEHAGEQPKKTPVSRLSHAGPSASDFLSGKNTQTIIHSTNENSLTGDFAYENNLVSTCAQKDWPVMNSIHSPSTGVAPQPTCPTNTSISSLATTKGQEDHSGEDEIILFAAQGRGGISGGCQHRDVRRTIISLNGAGGLKERESQNMVTELSDICDEERKIERIPSRSKTIMTSPLSLSAPTVSSPFLRESSERNDPHGPPPLRSQIPDNGLFSSVVCHRDSPASSCAGVAPTSSSVSDKSTSEEVIGSSRVDSTPSFVCSSAPDFMQEGDTERIFSPLFSSSVTANSTAKRTTMLFNTTSVSPLHVPSEAARQTLTCTLRGEGGSQENVRRTIVSFAPVVTPSPPLPSSTAAASPSVLPNVKETMISFSPLFSDTSNTSSATDSSLTTLSSPPPTLGSDTLLQAVSRRAEGSVHGFSNKKTFLIRKLSG